MVQKTSYRGVHSGNTLRAYNSRYSRLYHNQACIVSRIRPALLQKLDEVPLTIRRTKGDVMKTKPGNVAVNVALSLNKQARWLLPSSLIRQIQTGNIADSQLTVSVLECHKLKRQANCVSFHSNRGEVKRIQPQNGRYFGFSFPRADGKSRRAVRRERREQLQEQKGLKKKEKTTTTGKTVEVFTEQGRGGRGDQLGESEVRYEVYYPSPASSSISHNPKYIKQDEDASFGGSDQHVQHGKPRKQHRGKQRKRINLKDIDDWELFAGHSQPCQALTTTAHTVDQEEFLSLDGAKEERNPAECLLSSLIEKAQQLQNFKGVTKPRRKKKTSLCQEQDKSHIVYLSEFQEEGKSPAVELIESKEHSAQDKKTEEMAPSVHSFSPVPPESTRVLLPKDDVTMASLKDCFGECYHEVDCKPRKFVLDVTSSVRGLLKKQGVQAKVAEKTEEALSYLICVHDGFYDDEWDVYRVLLNTKLHDGLLTVEMNTQEQEGLFRGTVMNLISQTMDFLQNLVASLRDKSHFPVFIPDPTNASHHHLQGHLGSSEIYVPSVKRVFQRGSAISDIVLPTLSDLQQEGPVFCDVCYDDISPLTHGTAPSTALLTCNHHVCDSCWSQHIHIRLHEGFVRLTCLGYDCQEEVKVGVMLSVAPLDTVEKMLQRQEEVRIGASQTEKWCPNESCGRVISLQPSSSNTQHQFQQDVVCACGTHVCFQCLMPAHWPASCKQAEDYRANLATTTFPNRLAEVHDDYQEEEAARFKRKLAEKSTMVVEGKHCPTCRSFVLKNGGCPQMTCRCGQLFCWFCARPGFSHPDRYGCVDKNREQKLTTTVVVHHLDYSKQSGDDKQQRQPPSGNRRQRMSLMERAVEHRKLRQKQYGSQAVATLAKAVATAAGKNQVLTQHITKTCSEAFPSSIPNSSATVLEMVSSFLKNAVHSKQELLEVVEYSLVLLKDLPDSLLRRRALRISEDLGAFCSFSQSIFDVWGQRESSQVPLQEAVKALMRLAEIQGWVRAALDTLVVTVRKLRGLNFLQQ
ncbi:uncharacterized protein LOC143299420 [Babylonia areolata]|uniref:uncharacterized protein LOC143299420 n=1 Tax=Babylonia areolata TaxID=304850 RepID=UPI003FD071ED